MLAELGFTGLCSVGGNRFGGILQLSAVGFGPSARTRARGFG